MVSLSSERLGSRLFAAPLLLPLAIESLPQGQLAKPSVSVTVTKVRPRGLL